MPIFCGKCGIVVPVLVCFIQWRGEHRDVQRERDLV